MNKHPENKSSKNLEDLKKELDLIQLDERLEMVQLASIQLESDSGDGACCNSSCSGTQPTETIKPAP